MAEPIPEDAKKRSLDFFRDLEKRIEAYELRKKMQILVYVYSLLKKTSKSLIPANGKDAARERVLQYFLKYPQTPITGDELQLVSGIKDWGRRIRELRTEFGWPIVNNFNGCPGLQNGVYLLEEVRQSPPHDRKIPDFVRSEVLRRDDYACVQCGWTHFDWSRSDPRHLELHHVQAHVMGGKNTVENLITLCTVCHDRVHAKEKG